MAIFRLYIIFYLVVALLTFLAVMDYTFLQNGLFEEKPIDFLEWTFLTSE
jgi:hypothetical protein